MRKALAIAAICLTGATPALAEFDGPRVYWPIPKNTNIISFSRFEGRANLKFPVFENYRGTLDVAPDFWVGTYVRSQPLFGRTILWQASLPFGSLDTDSSLPLGATNTFADGIGDLTFGAAVNVAGVPELAVRDYLRWEETLSVNVGLHFSAPTGTYDANEALNMGSNRWSARLSAPIMWNIGDWVPGRRTTLEVMPAVRWFGDNDSSFGDTVEQDPLYSVEAHLTRDITKNAFASLDWTYLSGGAQTFVSNSTGLTTGTSDEVDAHFLGFTFGYQVNDNASFQLSHMQAISGDIGGFDADAAVTKLQFVWSWHDVLERRSDF